MSSSRRWPNSALDCETAAFDSSIWPRSRSHRGSGIPEGGVSLEAVEKELIVRALDRFHGKQTHAAKYLDVSRRTLIYRMEKFGIATASSADQQG